MVRKSQTISKAELRNHIREMLGMDPVYAPDDSGVNVSSVVDPQSPETVPVNPNFTPQDKVQFQVAVRTLVRNLPDEKMPGLYDSLKAAVDDCADEDAKKNSERETSMTMNDGEPTAEAIVRQEVRKILSELKDNGEQEQHGGDPDDPTYGREATFKQIADELGFSVAGAKQAVDKALQKAAFLAQQMSEPEREIMTLEAIKDYIHHLHSSGELSLADAQLMADHPTIVSELDGFREFLHRYVKRRMKGR